MEKWEEKAIGRKQRYADIGVKENLVAGSLNFSSYMANKSTPAALRFAANKVKANIDYKYNNSTTKGKYFKEGFRGFNWLKRVVGNAITNKAASYIKSPEHDYADVRWTTPSHQFVADNVFNKTITFDDEKRIKMLNDCGYAPNFNDVVSSLNAELSSTVDYYSAEKWRKEVMPHVLKVAYEEELDKTFKSINEHYANDKSLLSRGMMRVTMQKAAKHLGELFEDYSTEIANQTDYLEAPLTIFPVEKLDVPTDLNYTEKERWDSITHASLLNSQKELDKKINYAMSPYKVTAQRAQAVVANNTDSPIASYLSKKPYIAGEDATEDTRRYRTSVATVRDLKRVYEKRSFLGKWLTLSGYRERNAIAKLSDKLTTFGKSKEEIESHLDLKSELGKEFDDVSLLNYKQHTYWSTVADSIKDTASSVAENAYVGVYNASAATLNAGAYIAQKGLSATSAVVGTTAKAISAIGNSFMWAYNSVTGASKEPTSVTADPIAKDSELVQPDTKTVDGVEYEEAMEGPEDDLVKEQVIKQPDISEVKIASEQKANEPVAIDKDAQSINENVSDEDEFEDAQEFLDEDEFEDAHKIPLEGNLEFNESQTVAAQVDEPIKNEPAEDEISDKQREFDENLSAASKTAETTAAEKRAQSSYTSSILGTMYNYMPGRSYTPAEELAQKITQKEQESVKNMISAHTNDNAFYKSSAEFLYYKTIQNAIKPDYTQESCDMLANKFLTEPAVKNGVNVIQSSSAFKKAIVDKHVELQNTSESLQSDISPKNTSSTKLMNMYMSFVSEKARQASSDAQRSHNKQPVAAQQRKTKEKSSRDI